MTSLIAAVAELTSLRSKDDLEIALMTLMFNVVGATELRLLRVGRRAGEVGVREQMALPRVKPGGISGTKVAKAPLLFSKPMHADYRQCCDSKKHLQRPAGQNQTSSHLFPMTDGRDVLYILEIITPSPLMAGKISLVLELLNIYRNLVAMFDSSDRDELTGLLNRRTFNGSFKRLVGSIKVAPLIKKQLNPERRRPEYKSTNIHLAVIDIDFFKRINDQFGHPYGDEVLVLLARLMGECFREGDIIFRFGGEEFLVILPDTDFQDAEMALERLRAQVETFQFSQVGRVTVSIGFTTLVPGDSGPSAFGRADQALYVAKHSGRNQVQWYELLVAQGTLVAAAGNEQDVEMF